MKRFALSTVALLIVTPVSLFAGSQPLPWKDPSSKAFKLPAKDKEKLDALLKNANNLIIEANPQMDQRTFFEYVNNRMNSTSLRDAQAGLQKTVKELGEQIDRISASLSGILSSLSWRDRAEQLKESLFAILVTVNPDRAVAGSATRGLASEVAIAINDLIYKINQRIGR